MDDSALLREKLCDKSIPELEGLAPRLISGLLDTPCLTVSSLCMRRMGALH